jgi:arabinose-5-phosphate isomerase
MINVDLARTCITKQLAALDRLYSVITTDTYAELLEVVINTASYTSRNLLIAGVGKNAAVASKVADTFASLGIRAFALNVSHLGHGDYGRIGVQDAIIHLSRSGKTREMLEAIEHIKLIRPWCYQALVHCNPQIYKPAHLNLELCLGKVEEADEHGLAPTSTTTALLCLMDTIAVQASHDLRFTRLDFLKNHPDGALGALLKAEQEAS